MFQTVIFMNTCIKVNIPGSLLWYIEYFAMVATSYKEKKDLNSKNKESPSSCHGGGLGGED